MAVKYDPLTSNIRTSDISTSQISKLDGIEVGAQVNAPGTLLSSDIGVTVQASLSGASLGDVGTPASTDRILLQDASDSNSLKYAQFSTFSVGGSGSGTVTSVAISGTDGIQVDSGSPIISSGIIQLGVNKTAMLTFLNVEDGAQVNAPGTLLSSDIGVTVQGYDAGTLLSSDIGVTVQGYDAGTLLSSDIGVTVQGYDAGTLLSSDIGVTVQGYDAGILLSSDIGVTVQALLSGASLTDVGTPASGDRILLQDASDSNSLKYAQFSTFSVGGSGGLTVPQQSQLEALGYTVQRTVDTASPSAILITDGAILFDTTSTAIAITLPAASVGKVTIPFKDIGGNAATNNITINAVGGDTIVDVAVGQTSTVIAGNGFSGAFTSNGTNTWYLTYNSAVGGGGGGAESIDIQTFTASGTWTKPANAKYVSLYLISGGGGGGSGRKGAQYFSRYGGGGGGGGGVVIAEMLSPSIFDATVAVTVGAGGAGAAAVTASDTDGNAGSPGGETQFGTVYSEFAPPGGECGYGGTDTIGSGGLGGYFGLRSPAAIFVQLGAFDSPVTAGTGGDAGNPGVNSSPEYPLPGGGGGGSWVFGDDLAPSEEEYDSQYGSSPAQSLLGGDLGPVGPEPFLVPFGHGGAGNYTGLAGYDGGIYGGGGGGGGPGRNAVSDSGGGGDGGDGYAVIVTYCQA